MGKKKDEEKWNAPDPVRTLDDVIVKDTLPAMGRFASKVPGAVTSFGSRMAPSDSPVGLPGTVINPNTPGIRQSDFVPTWRSGASASGDWGPSTGGLLREVRSMSKDFDTAQNMTPSQARDLLPPDQQKRMSLDYGMPTARETEASRRMGDSSNPNPIRVSYSPSSEVLPERSGRYNPSTSRFYGMSPDELNSEKIKLSEERSRLEGELGIKPDKSTELIASIQMAMSNPTRKNRDRANVAIKALQALTGQKQADSQADYQKGMLENNKFQNESLAKYHEGQLNKPSFHALPVGTKGWTMNPDGTMTESADNTAPFLQREAMRESSKSNTLRARQAFTMMENESKAFTKRWDKASQDYADDPVAKKEAFQAINRDRFIGFGVPDDLASIPVGFNSFVESVLGGPGKKTTPENLATLRKTHDEISQARRAFMNKYFRSIGYHVGNVGQFLPSSNNRQDDED